MSLQLDWEEFRKFTPMQIMGLLLLRDEVLERFQEFLFPSVAKKRGKVLVGGPTSSEGQ